jgi:hypothetical protein
MTKKLKRLLKKHVDIVKSMYPELCIEVGMVIDDILIGISSQNISNEKKYKDLILTFIREYHSKGYYDVYWGVNSTLTCDNLVLLEDFVQIPEKENPKKKVINF